MVQQIKDFYQYVVFRNKNWYQAYSVVIPRKGKKNLTKKEIAHVAHLMSQMAESTIETLIKAEDPKYEKTENDLLAERIVRATELKG